MRHLSRTIRLRFWIRFGPLLLLLVLIVLTFLAGTQFERRLNRPVQSATMGGPQTNRQAVTTGFTLIQPGHINLKLSALNPARLVPLNRQARSAIEECIPTKALNDPAQPANCTWQDYWIDYTENGQFHIILDCSPESNSGWLASNPQWYQCEAYADGGTFYCAVPTDVVLKDATIRCSKTSGGTFLICNYNYMNIGDCNPSCDNVTITTSNTLTGVPDQVTAQNGTPVVCPLTTPACNAPTAGAPASGDWLLGSQNGLLVTTTAAQTYGNTLVQQYRTFFFGLALALLALPLAAGGLQLMRGGLSGSSRAGISAVFSNILLATGAVIISFYLIQLFINLESALVSTIFTTVQAPSIAVFMPSASWGGCAQQFFGNIFNLSVYHDQNITGSLPTDTYLHNTYTTTSTLVSNMSYYVLTLLSVLLAVQLVARLALLNSYIVVSPLTILCAALPGEQGSGIMRAWLRDFISLLFVQLLQFLVLWVCIQFIPQGWMSSGSGDWVKDLLVRVLPILILGMTLSVPRMLHTPATNMMATISSSIGGAMTGIILIIRGGI